MKFWALELIGWLIDWRVGLLEVIGWNAEDWRVRNERGRMGFIDTWSFVCLAPFVLSTYVYYLEILV